MKYIHVTTPDNIQVEYRLAGAGSRLAAVIIDTAIQGLIFTIALLIVLLAAIDFNSFTFRINTGGATTVISLMIILYFVLFFGYFLICEMLLRGQTIGKKIFGLRTIRQNGQPITIIQSIIRNISRPFIDNFGIGMIMMMFQKDNKRLGDLLAGTIVISENPERINRDFLLLKDPINSPADLASQQYPLTGEEYELIKDYFARKDILLDQGQAALERLRGYFSRKYQLDYELLSESFLHQLLMENAKSYK